MNTNPIPQKQFAAMILTSMLSPLLRSLPRAAVHSAGKGAWLCILPAFFFLLAMLALHRCFLRHLGPGKGYADLLLKWLGPVAGRLVLLLYWAWFLFYTGFILRSGSERLAAAVYPESAVFPFMLVVAALCLLVALGTLRAVGRCAVLLRSFLLVALGLILLFAAPNISRENLMPVPWMDYNGILLGSLPIAAIGGLAGSFPFLMGYVEPLKQPARKAIPLILATLAISGVLCIEVVGTFGPALTEKITYPFFLMVRDISIFRITQRIEAVVVVLWIFADFILCSSMLRCAHECIRAVFSLQNPEREPLFSLKNGRWLLWVETGLILLSGVLVTRTAFQLEEWGDHIIPLAGVLLMYVALLLFFFIGWIRGKTEPYKKGHGS